MDNCANVSERYGIIAMLSELLKRVKHHDSIVKKVTDKQAEIDKVQKMIDKPMKKFTAIQLILGILFVVIGWVILLVAYLMRKKKYKQLQAELVLKKGELQDEMTAIIAELTSYDNEELKPYIATLVPDRFPARYSMNAWAIEHMMNLAIDLRGDSIKEIINLHEEIRHRTKLELILGGVAANTKAAAINTKRAAEASEAAAASTAAAASAAASAAVSAQHAASRSTEVDVTVENNITIS